MGQQPQQVQAGQLSNTNLQPYMNPYTQSVINATLPLMQQQNALNQNQIGNQANSANAFGGSRQGLQQGVAQAQGAQNIGQMASQLNQANFQQAQQGAQFDITGQNQAALANQAAQQNQGNLNLQAASGLGALGNQAQLSQARNFTEQMTAGQMQQQQAQNQINAQMAKFQNANNYPNQQLSILQSALGMTPYEQGQQGSSTQQTQTAANPAQMALGGLSSLSSLMGIFSDRRLKTDITKVEFEARWASRSHAYRYKGDPKSYPKVVGPMAEDVAKTFGPGSVAKIPGSGGKMAVHPAVSGRACRARHGTADCSECHGRAADAGAEPCGDCRCKAADGRNGPAGRRGCNGWPTDAGAEPRCDCGRRPGTARRAEDDQAAPHARRDGATKGSLVAWLTTTSPI